MLSIRRIARNVAVLAALATALPVWAAAIYGTLKRGNQPIGNAAVTLDCGSASVPGTSDARGNYSLSIAASGRCTLRVGDKSAAVILGKDPVRYDFEVPATGTALVQH